MAIRSLAAHVASAVVLVGFALLALGSSKSKDDKDKGLTVTPASASVTAKAGDRSGDAPKADAKMGDRVDFDDSTWVVLDAKNGGKTLKSNNQFQEAAKTDGKFVIVHFKVTNKTKKEERLLEQPKVVDSKGREFGHLDSEMFYIPDGKKTLALEALPPSMAREFYSVFEVPDDATGLKIPGARVGALRREDRPRGSRLVGSTSDHTKVPVRARRAAGSCHASGAPGLCASCASPTRVRGRLEREHVCSSSDAADTGRAIISSSRFVPRRLPPSFMSPMSQRLPTPVRVRPCPRYPRAEARYAHLVVAAAVSATALGGCMPESYGGPYGDAGTGGQAAAGAGTTTTTGAGGAGAQGAGGTGGAAGLGGSAGHGRRGWSDRCWRCSRRWPCSRRWRRLTPLGSLPAARGTGSHVPAPFRSRVGEHGCRPWAALVHVASGQPEPICWRIMQRHRSDHAARTVLGSFAALVALSAATSTCSSGSGDDGGAGAGATTSTGSTTSSGLGGSGGAPTGGSGGSAGTGDGGAGGGAGTGGAGVVSDSRLGVHVLGSCNDCVKTLVDACPRVVKWIGGEGMDCLDSVPPALRQRGHGGPEGLRAGQRPLRSRLGRGRCRPGLLVANDPLARWRRRGQDQLARRAQRAR